MDPILSFSIPELQSRLSSGELSAKEVTETYLKRIEEVDERTKAYVTVDKVGALKQADEIDKQIAKKVNPGILAGVPVAVKDLFCTKDLKTTAASNILKDYVPPYDATAVRKLREEGAIILGKTNLDSFAHGSSTETSDFGPSHNPHDLTRHPGGSSGGSSAALAARECLTALGTETSGSARLAAGVTGTVAIKPTYGRISRYGVIAMGSSLDCVGPMSNSVIDAAVMLQAMAGKDVKDATTVNLPFGEIDHALEREEGLKGKKIGILKEGESSMGQLPPAMEETMKEAVKKLEEAGAEIVEGVSVPSCKVADAVYAIICTSEVSSNLMRYDGVHYGASAETNPGWSKDIKTLRDVYEITRGGSLATETKRRVIMGTYALSAGYYDAYYKRAAQVRTKIIREFEDVFTKVDFLVTAAAPSVAQKIGAAADDPTYGYTADDLLTYASSEAGLPAISVPAGFAKPDDGDTPMPVGLQLVAPQLHEMDLIRAGIAFEHATANADWRAQLEDPLGNA